ncbi:MAG: alcohol dehydrogenase catalytic domain-containing protein [Bacillota bacterium]
MKAVVKSAPTPGHLACIEMPMPIVKEKDVLIRVKAAGICGTDLSLWDWKEAVARTYSISSFPKVLGHEFSGIVEECGPGVDGLRPGDRVVVNPVMYCGKCSYCAAGAVAVCENRPMLGAELDGGFAEFVSVRASSVIPIPESISYESAAVIEPLCVAIQAVEKVPPAFGDVAVVVGAGPIGLLIALVLSTSYTSKVLVTGLKSDAERLGVARQMGAIPVNLDEEDPLELVRNMTGGAGADVVYEAAGHPVAILQAIEMVRPRGSVCLAGLPGLPTEIPTVKVTFQEKMLVGTRATAVGNWAQAIRMISAGRIDPTVVVSHRFSLAEAEGAFHMAKNRQGIKVLLIP